MFEVSGAFRGCEVTERIADFKPELVDSAGGSFAQQCLELGEDLLDGIEIGTVGRQIEEMRTLRFYGLANAFDLVGGQVVHDDDIARLENGRQELLGPGLECLAIHWTVKRHGGCDAIMAQGGQKGCGAPVAMRGLGQEPLADRAAATAAHHVGGEAGLVDEVEPRDIKSRLFLLPGFPRRFDVWPVLLACVQRFF